VAASCLGVANKLLWTCVVRLIARHASSSLQKWRRAYQIDAAFSRAKHVSRDYYDEYDVEKFTEVHGG
jgi:hypothetical protein